MARIDYDEQTAAAFKSVREIPRLGLTGWRDAVTRHLSVAPGMTLLDLGAGTGLFATACTAWFDIEVVAVEPSAAMRAQIPRTATIRVLEGNASAVPLPDQSADAAWLSLVIHHIRDLPAAAHEIRRVLRPGGLVLIRQGFPGRLGGVELVQWFPETARVVETYPSVEDTCKAFASAGFQKQALEQVEETYAGTVADFLAQVDTFRQADTTMRALSDEEFFQGKERLRDAVRRGHGADTRRNSLDLLVLR